jgi:hypothetical protein
VNFVAIAYRSQSSRAEVAALLDEMRQRELVDDAMPELIHGGLDGDDDDDDVPELLGEDSASSASEGDSHPPLLADSDDDGDDDGQGSEDAEDENEDGDGDDGGGDGGNLNESQNDEDDADEHGHADEDGDEDAAVLEESVSALMSMGFAHAQVMIALQTSGFDVDVAATRLLMAGADELPAWEVGQALDVRALADGQWRAGRVTEVADDASAVLVRVVMPDGSGAIDQWIAADSQRLAPAETHVVAASSSSPAPAAANASPAAAAGASAVAAASAAASDASGSSAPDAVASHAPAAAAGAFGAAAPSSSDGANR